MLKEYIYIEFNPVSAEMVTDPGEYRWSSYKINALGNASKLCNPHHDYLDLGPDPIARQENYRELLTEHVDGKLLK